MKQGELACFITLAQTPSYHTFFLSENLD